MCNFEEGVTLVRDISFKTYKKKFSYQIYYTFFEDGYSTIFKEGIKWAYIINKDGTFNEIINLVEYVTSNGSTHKHNNLVDYFGKTNFNIKKQQCLVPIIDRSISMDTRYEILEICGFQKGMRDFTEIMHKYNRSLLWPSLFRHGGGILDIDLYLKSVKNKLESMKLDNIVRELHDLIAPDLEEPYWSDIDVPIDNNLMAILLRLYTLSIQDQYQEYDYIMFQISNYLIAGNPDKKIYDVYFKLQDERLANYRLKIFDVDDKILIKIVNIFHDELVVISSAIYYLSRRTRI